MNRRRVTLIGLSIGLALIIAGCIGAQRVGSAVQAILIVPGATEVELRSAGFGEQRITYRAPGPAYAWFFSTTRNLAKNGWTAPVDTRSQVRSTPVVYWRISKIWFIYISERIALQGEPNVAQISVRRQLIFPWRRLLP